MQTYDNDSKNPIVQAALDQPAELNLESVAAGDNLPVPIGSMLIVSKKTTLT